MKVSEFILNLVSILRDHGDLEVGVYNEDFDEFTSVEVGTGVIKVHSLVEHVCLLCTEPRLLPEGDQRKVTKNGDLIEKNHHECG